MTSGQKVAAEWGPVKPRVWPFSNTSRGPTLGSPTPDPSSRLPRSSGMPPSFCSVFLVLVPASFVKALPLDASTWRAIGASVISGVAFGISLPPGSLGLLAGVAWVPLLIRWMQAPPRRMAVEAFAAWVVAAAVGVSWVLQHPFPATRWASAGGLLTWAFLFALPWPLSAAVRRRWGLPAGLLALLALHLGVEGLLSRGPWAFPWALLGHALSEVTIVRQLAAVGGVSLLSAWLAGVNGAVAGLWTGRVSRKGSLLVLAGLLVGGAGADRWSSSATSPPTSSSMSSPMSSTDTRQALLIQPGTPPARWADVDDRFRVAHLQSLTTSALDTLSTPPDVIVWPETALPVLPPEEQDSLTRSVQAWIGDLEVPLVTGGIVHAPSTAHSAAPSPYRNRAWFFQPPRPDRPALDDRSSPQTYDKHHLVPFAERVPGIDAVPGLRALRVPAGGVPGYQRGDGPVVWDTPLGPASPMICFESVVLPYALEAARAGANLFITVAQTGWWGPGAGPEQHLAFSRLTAIATGRPILLSTVQGPSTLISPTGTSTPWPPFGSEAVVELDVPHTATQTLFLRIGDLAFVGAAFVGAGMLLALGGRVLRERRSWTPPPG